MPALESNVIQVLADFTAGDPSVPEVVWTYLTPEEISEELAMAGTPVGTDTARQILDDFGFVQRKAQKYLAMGASPDRDAQFQRIAAHKAEYQSSGNPILSMDAKKKEHLGNYFRSGRLYTTGVLRTLDHDFHSSDDPVVIQHGLFDVKRNVGHITLGTSHETSGQGNSRHPYITDADLPNWERRDCARKSKASPNPFSRPLCAHEGLGPRRGAFQYKWRRVA